MNIVLRQTPRILVSFSIFSPTTHSKLHAARAFVGSRRNAKKSHSFSFFFAIFSSMKMLVLVFALVSATKQQSHDKLSTFLWVQQIFLLRFLLFLRCKSSTGAMELVQKKKVNNFVHKSSRRADRKIAMNMKICSFCINSEAGATISPCHRACINKLLLKNMSGVFSSNDKLHYHRSENNYNRELIEQLCGEDGKINWYLSSQTVSLLPSLPVIQNKYGRSNEFPKFSHLLNEITPVSQKKKKALLEILNKAKEVYPWMGTFMKVSKTFIQNFCVASNFLSLPASVAGVDHSFFEPSQFKASIFNPFSRLWFFWSSENRKQHLKILEGEKETFSPIHSVRES